MVTWTDESAYVHLGYFSVTGQISLFQDELTGSRMPRPFWTVGRSQVMTAAALPVAFFLSDMRYLKILAYMPVVGRLVCSLGYPMRWSLIDVTEPTLWDRALDRHSAGPHV